MMLFLLCRFGESYGPNWRPQGDLIRKQYDGDYPDIGVTAGT